jgi:hypothetical protein
MVLNILLTRRHVAASNTLKPARRAIAANSDRSVMSDSIASARVTSGNATSANVMARATRRSDGERESRANMPITIQTQPSAEPNEFRPYSKASTNATYSLAPTQIIYGTVLKISCTTMSVVASTKPKAATMTTAAGSDV